MSELKSHSLLADIAKQGLWKNNPALVQILGLCPTLAVTTSATNALGLGIATTAVLMMSNLAISLVRSWVPNEIRIPVYVMIIAALVTCVQLLMNAYLFELYQALGIFIALIVTNCIIIGRAEAFANRNPPLLALFDGLMMGLGFTLILLLLGSVREILGQGTLFAGASLLLAACGSSPRPVVLRRSDLPMRSNSWAPSRLSSSFSSRLMLAFCSRSCPQEHSWLWASSSPSRI